MGVWRTRVRSRPELAIYLDLQSEEISHEKSACAPSPILSSSFSLSSGGTGG